MDGVLGSVHCYDTTGGLNDRHFISHSFRGSVPKMKVLAGLAPGALVVLFLSDTDCSDLREQCLRSESPCSGQKQHWCVFLFTKVARSPASWSSYLPNVSSTNITTIKASAYELRRYISICNRLVLSSLYKFPGSQGCTGSTIELTKKVQEGKIGPWWADFSIPSK